MRRALRRRKVGKGECTAAARVVGTSAQDVGIGARIARNARVLEEQREIGDGVFRLAALDHRRHIREDGILSALACVCRRAPLPCGIPIDLKAARRSRLLIRCTASQRLVRRAQLVTLLPQTLQLRLIPRKRLEVDAVRVHGADEMNAIAPRIADQLGCHLLVQNAQHGSSDRTHLIARQRIALHFARALDVDARPLSRRAHRLRTCGIPRRFWRVAVAHHIDAVRLDDLRRSTDGCGAAETKCADGGAQNIFQHDTHSRLYCSKGRLSSNEREMKRMLFLWQEGI